MAEALAYWITDGVARDATTGGPLAALATHARFGRLFDISERSLQILSRWEPLPAKLDETLALVQALNERFAAPDRAPAHSSAALVAERARSFVGRGWVIARLDEILSAPGFTSGYVLITGEPGIGKTSLLSYLVSTRGLIHHFNSRAEGPTSATAFFRMVSAQLAARYGVQEATFSDTSMSGAQFSDLLYRAAMSASAERPLVLAIDALDEAEVPSPGANRLFLPRVLPPHTYVVATSRELDDQHLRVDRREVVHIPDDAPANLADITEYIRSSSSGPNAAAFAARRNAWSMTETEFESFLASRSEGNFLYISYMLADIAYDRLPEAALSDPSLLPVGLKEYYKNHWDVMRQRWPQTMAGKYEAALRCLAVMREPVPIQTWTDFAPEEVDETVARHVIREWRQFLNTRWSDHYNTFLYVVYHSTFVDFLRDEGPGLEPYEQHVYESQRDLVLGVLTMVDRHRPASG
ncbi:ATP-binding protein [Actinomadura soli]|uniref:ATP-binding protein n=1 Tax=Actinomadura soli TaxID=2508997 RepID=A0A5C4J7A7_9ACTN|nr:ATP-binding protein [Actinomadura soli]TMQ94552.1 ATP-binding protein [Actinomadura soli]